MDGQLSALEQERALWNQAESGETETPAEPATEPVETAPEAPAEEPAPVVEPEEAPAEVVAEPEAEATEEPAPKAKEQKVVPLAALMEERRKAREAEQALKDAERELAVEKARQEERAKFLQQQQQANQPPPQTEEEYLKSVLERQIGKRPSEDEDIFAAQQWDHRLELEKTKLATARAQATAEALQMRANLEADRAEFRKTAPDYEDALKFLIENQRKFYELAGRSEQEAWALTNNDAGALIMGAQRQNRSVAQTIYDLAKLRGYKAPEAAPVEPSKPGPKPPTAAEKLATIQEGQQLTSLSRASGVSSAKEMTDAQIDNMSRQELSEWLKNPKNAARYHRMLGE